MPDLNGYEASSLTEVEAVLDGLDPATSEEVYLATLNHDARAVAAVAAARADAGGGASFPDEWTVSADGALKISSSDATVSALHVEGQVGAADPIFKITPPGESFAALAVSSFGEVNIQPVTGAFQGLTVDNFTGGPGFGLLKVTFDGSHVFRVDADGSFMAGSNLFQVGADGGFSTRANAAPSDGSLTEGEMAIWFDATDGAAKLRVKAKTNDGTVRVGTLALT